MVVSSIVLCPVCKEACKEPPIACYSVERAAAHFCPPWRDADRNRRLKTCLRRLWAEEGCSILRCPNCGFAFGHPFVGGDEEFYGILHEQMGYPGWRWDYDVACEIALPHFPHGGCILDIGAGSGVFLNWLGSDWAKHAVEGSDATREILRGSGITVHRSLEEAVESQFAAFDFITIFQVLEHLANFRSILSLCQRLLRPGGRLLITVPDGEAMIRQEKLTGCPDMPPSHINKWTPSSLELALSHAGLSLIGPAIPEPPGRSNIYKHLHLALIASAARPGSLAAVAYRIKQKRLRVPVLALVGAIMLPGLLPNWRELRSGGAFASLSIKRP